MRTIIAILSILFSINFAYSQELNCNFSINTSKIQGTNRQVFESMEELIRDFLNNTVWTNHVFESEERIECNIMLDIKEEITANEYKARLSVQSRRPVFNSSYTSVIFNYLDDDVEFSYQEGDPLDLSENTFISNLSSLFSFYAYIIIGMDYDSFSPLGGTPFFEKAEKIVSAAQSSSYTGWKSGDDRERKNRYWLVDNLLDEDYETLRQFYYRYHRHCLDAMESSVDQGRTELFRTLEDLEKFNANKPDPFTGLLQVVVDSKFNEIVNIFSESPKDQKTKVLKILTKIDPAGGRKFAPLKD